MENTENPVSAEVINGSDPAASERSRSLPAWVVVVAFLVLLLFLGLVWWGLNRSSQPPILVGEMVPPIVLTTFDGKQVKLADLSGKVVLVNFWASWCKPCEQEAEEMETVWRKYKDGGQVVFLGVDYVDTEPEALAYLKKFNITYTNGPDLRTQISQLFRIKGVPETYLIDKNGRLANFKIGPYTSTAELQAMIEPLLK